VCSPVSSLQIQSENPAVIIAMPPFNIEQELNPVSADKLEANSNFTMSLRYATPGKPGNRQVNRFQVGFPLPRNGISCSSDA
jgi:hypothetical protein